MSDNNAETFLKEQNELLSSVSLVFKDIIEEPRNSSMFRGNFEIGPNFKGDTDQKGKVYRALEEILRGPGRNISFDTRRGCLYTQAHIDGAVTDTDRGRQLEPQVQSTLQILNSAEVQEALVAYFVFLDKKIKVDSLRKV